jgi:hypothetical protein
MGYEPGIISYMSRVYTHLQDRGVNAWYGDAGDDTELAKMILDDKPMEELLAYCKEYGYLEEEDN